MELSPNRREETLITIIRLMSLILLALTLFFYQYLHKRVAIFLLCLILLVLVFSRLSSYKKVYYSILFYTKILSVFLPISLSLNFVKFTPLHFVIIITLFTSLFLTMFLDNLELSNIKNKLYFVFSSIFFLLTLILFVAFYPIRSEYQVSIEISQVIYRSLYLITLFFLLYHLFWVLEQYRHKYNFGIVGVINSDNTLIVYSIFILSLSLYDTIALRSVTYKYLRASVVQSEDDLLNLSRRLYIKGMHNENIKLLYSSIERGLSRQEQGALRIIDFAQKEYPYECLFFKQKMEYFSRLNKLDELEMVKRNIPATLVKKGCLIDDK